MDSPSHVDLLAETLSRAHVLRRLDRASLQAIAAAGRDEAFDRGQCIAPHDNSGHVFVVMNGAVRLLWSTPGGLEVALSRLRPGALFSIDEGPGDFGDSILAVSDTSKTRLFRVAADRFMDVTMSVPDATRELVFIQHEYLVERCSTLADVAFTPLEQRLYHRICRLARESDDGCVGETHMDLAQMVGATRERVTKTLGHLRDRGMIGYTPHGHRIRVVDPEVAGDGRGLPG